jgi:hypothetical protein
MWLAHLRGARRIIDGFVARQNTANAAGWVTTALAIAKDGEAWKGAEFPQDQWLEWVRVQWLACTLQPAGTDINSLQSLLKWYVDETNKKKAAAWQPADVTKSKLLAAQAALDTALSRHARAQKKDAEAAQRAAAAEKGAREAVALADGAAKDGGPLPASFPYRVLADALRLQGKADEAAQAEKSAAAAAHHNPD